MNVRRSLLLMLCCLPLLGALAAGFGRDPHAVPSVLVGKPAPTFHLTGVDGTPVRSESLRGRPAVINFWATWCYPCQAEHPLLQALAKQTAGRLQVLGVIYEDSAEAAADYLQKHPSPYPHLLDPGSVLAMDCGVAGVPESFVVDANGIVRYKHAGVLTPDVIAREITPLLAPAGQAP